RSIRTTPLRAPCFLAGFMGGGAAFFWTFTSCTTTVSRPGGAAAFGDWAAASAEARVAHATPVETIAARSRFLTAVRSGWWFAGIMDSVQLEARLGRSARRRAVVVLVAGLPLRGTRGLRRAGPGRLRLGEVSFVLEPAAHPPGAVELPAYRLPLGVVEDRPELGLGQPGRLEDDPVVVVRAELPGRAGLFQQQGQQAEPLLVAQHEALLQRQHDPVDAGLMQAQPPGIVPRPGRPR